jgi:uncharacterized delta-60 repeat protein
MSHTRNHAFRPRLRRLEDRTSPAAGALDPTFGIGGRVTTRFPVPSADDGHSTVIDSLGRIIIAGNTNNGSTYHFAVARLTSAGALDLSFGGTGIVTIAFSASDIANDVTVDSQNRIVVAGYADNGSGVADFAVARLTAAGALDNTFDGDGKQTIAFGAADDIAYSVAVDSLDRVVIGGFSNIGSNGAFAVARLTTVGVLDTSFDGDGKQTFDFGAPGSGAWGMEVDPLNRIVIAGTVTNGSTSDFAVARLTVAGAFDNSFDGDGKQTIDFGAFSDEAQGVDLDSMGRIVVVGDTYNGSNVDFAVARLTAAGALDSSFDGDGKQTIAFTVSDIAEAVAIDSLDRVVLAGNTNDGSNPAFAVARLTAAGALDNSFDGDGRQTVDFSAFDDGAFGIAVDSANRAVVAGFTDNGSNFDFAVARLTAAGALDASFDGDGKKTFGLTAGSQAGGRSVAVDSLGRTVVAGYVWNGSNNDFAVTRYTIAGALDTTFGGTGIAKFAFGQDSLAYGVAVDSLDRIVVAGATFNGSDYDFAVARLTTAGALDSSFDVDGKQTIDFGALDDTAFGVAIDSLGRIVVAGATFNGTDYDFAVARLTAAGALDNSFAGDGRQTIALGTSYNYGNAVAVDSLDRIVVVGSTFNGLDYDFVMARLTAAGALDSSFDGDGKQTVAFGDDYGYAVAVDSLDRVVVTGLTYTGVNNDFAVARLTPAGALDSSFDGDGKQTIDFGAGDDGAFGVAIDSLNRIVTAGNTFNFSTFNSDFAVARLTAAGALDSSFDGDGKQTVDFGFSLVEIAYGVAVNSADRVVLAGTSDYNGYVFAVAHLTGDTTTALAQVNDGSAQRSRVTSLTVRFSSQVTFSGVPAQAFTLSRTGGGAVTFIANVSIEYGATVVTLNNFTGPETNFGSLRDGRYTLTALASQINAGGQALDGDADGTPGGNFVFGDAQGLFRFFGDINGDRHVDIADFGLFSQSIFNSANYIAAFDYNNDGHVDIQDFGQFSVRLFSPLP